MFFGNDCMMSTDIFIRNADPHLIYSTETKRRVNPTRSVFVGDHVWIGQDVMLLKGTQIGSGSIVGAHAVVSGKKIPSNTSWAGNPARQIGEKIFWSRECVHGWTAAETNKFAEMPTDIFTFKHDPKQYLSFDEIDRRLNECQTSDAKLQYLIALSNYNAKNRFAI